MKLITQTLLALSLLLVGYAAHAQADPYVGKKFRLKTQFRGDGECLESNSTKYVDLHSGASFMDKVQNVTGEFWMIEKQPNGAYRLKSEFQGANKCLEGNSASSPTMAGAAFMDDCKNVTGQYWKIVPASGGYVKLMTMSGNQCLEGNEPGSKVHNGAAFMNTPQNVTGQLWKIEEMK